MTGETGFLKAKSDKLVYLSNKSPEKNAELIVRKRS